MTCHTWDAHLTPPTLAPPSHRYPCKPDILASAQARAQASGSRVESTHDPLVAVKGANVIVTDTVSPYLPPSPLHLPVFLHHRPVSSSHHHHLTTLSPLPLSTVDLHGR
eukprot:TRINITY_DN549_c0_g1_i12.p2 TRINITY_DN549_c0_g1~~TRINITY_DN549_c0_g1_i12.p2  ORF type:complete len:109 (+),score=0.79 TRINITY_DN549_c0_g1_i12:458-784(+)